MDSCCEVLEDARYILGGSCVKFVLGLSVCDIYKFELKNH